MTDHISKKKFMEELRRYQKGSVTRRHFLGVTGLGAATAVLGSTIPGLRATTAMASDIGDRVVLATWPNYHDESNFEMFTDKTGAAVPEHVLRPLLEVRPEYLKACFEEIRKRYESREHFFETALSLDDSKIEQLKDRYLH